MQFQTKQSLTPIKNDGGIYHQTTTALSKLMVNHRNEKSPLNNSILSLSSTGGGVSGASGAGNNSMSQNGYYQTQQQQESLKARPFFNHNDNWNKHRHHPSDQIYYENIKRSITPELARPSKNNTNLISKGQRNLAITNGIISNRVDDLSKKALQFQDDKSTSSKKHNFASLSNYASSSSSLISPKANMNMHPSTTCNYFANTPNQKKGIYPHHNYHPSWHTPTKTLASSSLTSSNTTTFRDPNCYEPPLSKDISHSIGVLNRADETLMKSSILRSTINTSPFKGASGVTERTNYFQLNGNKVSLTSPNCPGTVRDLVNKADETLMKSYYANSGLKINTPFPTLLSSDDHYHHHTDRYNNQNLMMATTPTMMQANHENYNITPSKMRFRQEIDENYHDSSRHNFIHNNRNGYTKNSPLLSSNSRSITPIKSIQDTKDLIIKADKILRSSSQNRIASINTPTNSMKKKFEYHHVQNNLQNHPQTHNQFEYNTNNEFKKQQDTQKAEIVNTTNETNQSNNQTITSMTIINMTNNSRGPTFSNNQLNHSTSIASNTHTFNPQNSISSYGSKKNSLNNIAKFCRLSNNSQTDRNYENFGQKILDTCNEDPENNEEIMEIKDQVSKSENITKNNADLIGNLSKNQNNSHSNQCVEASSGYDMNENEQNFGISPPVFNTGGSSVFANEDKEKEKVKNCSINEACQEKKRGNVQDTQMFKYALKDKSSSLNLTNNNSNSNNSNSHNTTQKKQLSTYEQILAKRAKSPNLTKQSSSFLNQGKSYQSTQNIDTIKEIDRDGSTGESISMPIAVATTTTPEKNIVIEELYEDGTRYIGEKTNGYKQGHGQFFNIDGTYYDGEWELDKKSGYGILYDRNRNAIYDGEWLDDKYHGNGILYSNSSIYGGNDDAISAKGSIEYINLNKMSNKWEKYEGEFINGKKHGVGVLYFIGNCRFSGRFKNDLAYGSGVFYLPDETMIQGYWENNKYVGNDKQ